MCRRNAMNPFSRSPAASAGLALAAVLMATSAGRADELRALGGKSVTGKLQSVTDKEIVLETKEGAVATPLSQALVLDIRKAKGIAPGARYIDVRLIDDSVLHCHSVAFEGNNVSL